MSLPEPHSHSLLPTLPRLLEDLSNGDSLGLWGCFSRTPEVLGWLICTGEVTYLAMYGVCNYMDNFHFKSLSTVGLAIAFLIIIRS